MTAPAPAGTVFCLIANKSSTSRRNEKNYRNLGRGQQVEYQLSKAFPEFIHLV
jgi:hypothetical protein